MRPLVRHVLLLLLACGGGDASREECHADADCRADFFCRAGVCLRWSSDSSDASTGDGGAEWTTDAGTGPEPKGDHHG